MSDCLFCKIAAWDIPCHKVYEDEHTLAFLDIYPAGKYHTLVIPKNHSTNMFDISFEDLWHVMETVRKVIALYKEKLGITDVQVFTNAWAVAQQTVFHTHYHILPRQEWDENDRHHESHPELLEDVESMLQRIF